MIDIRKCNGEIRQNNIQKIKLNCENCEKKILYCENNTKNHVFESDDFGNNCGLTGEENPIRIVTSSKNKHKSTRALQLSAAPFVVTELNGQQGGTGL